MHSAAAYQGLVERLEREAAQRPGWYRFKLLLLALLGYGFLCIALVLALALSLGLGLLLVVTKSVLLLKLIKLVWIPLAIAWVILRAMWVRISEPEGHRLLPGEAPELEAEVERLRRSAGAPALAGIVIDPDLNAAAASVPRLLGLAGNRHYLVLGLPLMRLLDQQQLAAVIAHEFGHFNGGHGRFSGWIYRVRVSWYRLLESFAAQGTAGAGVFTRFFAWYAPYFNAYSFVLARSNEYEADAVSARIAGAESAAHALVKVNVAAERLHSEFWPGVGRLNATQETPPPALYADMARTLAAVRDDDAEALARFMARKPDLDDTHPVLAQRLAAMRVQPALPVPMQHSAADALLGPLAEQLQSQFDQQWRSVVADGWQRRHAELAADRERLDALETQRLGRDLDAQEAFQYAMLVEDVRSEAEALGLYRQLLPTQPDNMALHFRLGAILLRRGDGDGVALLERAILLDEDVSGMALECMAQFQSERGDTEALNLARERLEAVYRQQAAANRQRGVLDRGDVFLLHALSAKALQDVHEAIARVGGVGRAWLVRKQIKGGGKLPHYVLLVAWRGMVWSEERKLQALADAMPLEGSWIVVTKGSSGGTAGGIRKAAGEPMYRRGWF